MEKIRAALVWARKNKRTVLAVTAVVAALAARYVPGLPTEHIVNAVSALLGA
ncbi:hypothetical protein OG301_26700 [Streptomyces platensis]|uniref:hypothetical protein n=1 Tax=Streptomyces platensis TaxID=58346 RepID=UPI002ED31A83|nr:hypothetical protein OG301_26700 [Streptomyces platensis]